MDALGGTLRSGLGAAVAGGGSPLAVADRLCLACVDLMDVDGAAVSLIDGGSTQGTFGSSGELSRRLDEFQFTFGEGPCLDAVASRRPVLVEDLRGSGGRRWPAFAGEALDAGVCAVFALPIAVASISIGALDLFRADAGPLSADALSGALWAAELAALPLFDLMTAPGLDSQGHTESRDGWDQLASLQRVEVYQATGMLIAHLNVDGAEALVRLRAYAFAHGQTASDVARAIVERRIVLASDQEWQRPGGSDEEAS
jgi:hypothetical protein